MTNWPFVQFLGDNFVFLPNYFKILSLVTDTIGNALEDYPTLVSL